MSSVFFKTVTVLSSRMLTRASQVVAFVLLARVLSPEGFGAYGVLTSAVYLAGQIGNLGLRQSAAYRIGRKEMTDGQSMGLLAAFWPVASIVCVVVVFFINRSALTELSTSTVGWGSASALATALGLGVALVILLSLVQGVFLGRGEIKSFAVADAGPRVLQSALAALLWLSGALSITTAIWSFAAGFLVITPVALWLALKGSAPLRLPIKAAPGMIRHGFLFAVSLFLITLQGRVGVFVLSSMVSHSAAGQFFAAQRAGEIFLELASAVALVSFSETTRGRSQEESLRSALGSATTLFVTFLLIGACVAAAAPIVVKVLLGSQYAGSVDALRLVAIGLAPAAFVRVTNSVIGGLGKPWISGSVVAGGLVVNFAACLLLLPYLGPNAVCVALVFAQFTCAAIYLLMIMRWLKLSAFDLFSDVQSRLSNLRLPLKRFRLRKT